MHIPVVPSKRGVSIKATKHTLAASIDRGCRSDSLSGPGPSRNRVQHFRSAGSVLRLGSLVTKGKGPAHETGHEMSFELAGLTYAGKVLDGPKFERT